MSSHDHSAEPSHQVGTRLLFENDRVRVWEMVLRPGESSARHVHDSDYLFVSTTPGRLTLIQDGSPPETSEEPAGFVQYSEVGSGIVHSVKNVGDDEYREILVELKGPSRSQSPAEPQTNQAD
jgi:quercetin dioxygenase-like cupin family protein